MTLFSEFLEGLLTSGEAQYRVYPGVWVERTDAIDEILERHFHEHSLHVAGERIPFRAEIAIAAAQRVAWAGWFLVSSEESPEFIEASLCWSRPDDQPATHLSADLCLRFMVDCHRRARARRIDDPLTRSLERVLCNWPLSGVLADRIADVGVEPSLGGHFGLQLLYAERLQKHPKPEWIPRAQPFLDIYDWVRSA